LNREKSRNQIGLCILCGKNKSGSSKKCSKCYAKEVSSFHFGSVDRADELFCLLNHQNGICPYTGIKLVIGDNASLDHKIPKSKGGGDDLDNLQWLYFGIFDVNKMKWNLTDKEFIEAILILSKKVGKNGMQK
jgi:5-methylcytosine-specific restriction endonuclease McrA